MSILNIVQKIFGNKQSRDDKKYQPIVEEIKKAGEALVNISNDELRQKIDEVRADIAASVKDDEQAIV